MSSTVRRGLAETSSSGGNVSLPWRAAFAVWTMTVGAELCVHDGWTAGRCFDPAVVGVAE